MADHRGPQNDEPFDVGVVVECLMQLAASALRSAAVLDPTLDIEATLRPLIDEFSASRRTGGSEQGQ
ncbi:hypothetical protein APR12_001331 [Nocardia amikacinitolerans]|uniref:hypothetical protein n=1 Tax=Nocardia amikacinitolerans TaxID=756689 RepID=UPI0008305B38|nr:hypothetical protein [Nocardia amikacinitolerans]MCP2315998.1 hypothetical protein [Nocardia amikacinitolerans]